MIMNATQARLEEARRLLHEIEEIDAAVALTEAERENAKRELLGDPLWIELKAIDEEFEPMIEAARKRSAELKKMLRSYARVLGESLDGERYRAVYVKGRVKITDPAALLELAERIPELAAIIQVTPPTYQIKAKS